jgi:class 3 adenylate cyclase/tetratricopeptide (TPR) repeat protein
MTCAACHAPIGDNIRFCPMCGTPVSAPGTTREARKNVAILFMDLVGSTALAESLDPEPLSQIMDRYFDAASAAIVAHGGEVEKFIGDAVMAVFGATVSHEDDALRAVRAALEAVGQVNELSAGLVTSHKVTLEVRCGVCSGEVIAITNPAGGFRVIGDPVNTAARLQTAAEPGQILVDAASASMIRTSVGIEPVPPLHLKGKAQPVPAWRVTSAELIAEPTGQQPAAPLIGREDELTELRSAFRRVTKRNQLCLVTLLGMPGIGKSRLVRDFVAAFGPAEVSVLTGKCSAYGRGITYQPLAEMLKASGWADQARRLEAAGGDAGRAARSLASVMGGSSPIGTAAAGGAAGIEEISWAVRYLVRQLGKKKPVIMIWEDLHWAESTLLDMIDDVVNWLTDVPVLLVCVSRMELLDARPSWAGGKPSVMTMEVGPLNPAESAQLVGEIAMLEEVNAHQAEALCERVAAECEGNPLFAELMLDVFAETAPGAKLPPTVTALLTARLDQLPHDERELLEVASAVGRDFSQGALAAIFAEEGTGGHSTVANPGEVLDRLVKRRIITRAGAGNFRFVQVLMRDMAYQLSAKTKRERWHLVLAAQLAELGGQLDLARHVEAARLLQHELRPGDSGLPEFAPQAAGIFIAEGTTALHRRDLPSAAALLERGRALLPADDERQLPLMLYISDCWLALSDPAQAVATVKAHADPAVTEFGLASRRRQIVCRIQLGIIERTLGLCDEEETAALADELDSELASLERFGAESENRARCRLHQLRAYLHQAAGASAKAEAQFRLALDRARSLQDGYETDRMLVAICELAQWTPTPVDASLKLCAEMSERFATNRVMLLPVLLTKARLEAVSGDLAAAKAALSAASEYTADLHLDLAEVVITAVSGLVDSLAGDHRGAEASYRRSQGLLLQIGRSGDSMAYEAYAAREIFEQGNLPGAQQAADRLAAGTAAMDLRTKVTVTALRARIAAARGRAAQALQLAGESTNLSDRTDDLCLQGDCYLDLAIVAAAAGQPVAAAEAGRNALDRYEAKGARLLAVRARRLIAGAGG